MQIRILDAKLGAEIVSHLVHEIADENRLVLQMDGRQRASLCRRRTTPQCNESLSANEGVAEAVPFRALLQAAETVEGSFESLRERRRWHQVRHQRGERYVQQPRQRHLVQRQAEGDVQPRWVTAAIDGLVSGRVVTVQELDVIRKP